VLSRRSTWMSVSFSYEPLKPGVDQARKIPNDGRKFG
jgi:hypothetical protein